MKAIQLVDLQRQYKTLKKDIPSAVNKILAKGNFILGEEVADFEKNFAKYCGVKHCIGVASGTDALLLSLRALGTAPGDEVITVANTFIATVLPIIYLGAKPVLVDCDSDTYQIDPKLIEKAITRKTKVIIPVHLYGTPASMKAILKIAKKHKLYILEDACQAHGSSLAGKKCGSFGDIAAFSFYPGKNLGAAGDGGAIVTNNDLLANNVRIIRNVGQAAKYKHDLIGYNSRLDTVHAAYLNVKLKKLERWNAQRRRIAKLYHDLLTGLPLFLPPLSDKMRILNHHLYVIRTERRDELLNFLHQNNIFAGMHYPIPVHLQKSMEGLKYTNGDFPLTEKYANEILSLPMFPELTKKEVMYICRKIKEFFKNGKT
ncbi:DegT/DnrJ/EryC1/StrS family aminotransferase [Candidatus Microgenomates bacterium]|nr:DegT/DnrJ/EryC1/StrS family aminotransferase [Candidatus Microgenomates bacterium]